VGERRRDDAARVDEVFGARLLNATLTIVIVVRAMLTSAIVARANVTGPKSMARSLVARLQVRRPMASGETTNAVERATMHLSKTPSARNEKSVHAICTNP
jgi:hypothetical protein